jgi:hypothetical protein
MTRRTLSRLALLCLWAAACRSPATDPVEGGIYSAVSDPQKGTYGIVKVLKVEIAAVHVRLYAGEHKTRPTQVNPGELKIGTMAEGGGMGHLPLSHRVFAAWKPVRITTAAVDRSELDGYDEWKKAGGGVWDE